MNKVSRSLVIGKHLESSNLKYSNSCFGDPPPLHRFVHRWNTLASIFRDEETR